MFTSELPGSHWSQFVGNLLHSFPTKEKFGGRWNVPFNSAVAALFNSISNKCDEMHLLLKSTIFMIVYSALWYIVYSVYITNK
jgi:hypothetical protein